MEIQNKKPFLIKKYAKKMIYIAYNFLRLKKINKYSISVIDKILTASIHQF